VSPSVFIVVRRKGADGGWTSAKSGRGIDVRYVVRYRLGGRGARVRHAGSFRTRREAEERARFIAGELAARRVPELGVLEIVERAEPARRTVQGEAERFAASRIDVGRSAKASTGRRSYDWASSR